MEMASSEQGHHNMYIIEINLMVLCGMFKIWDISLPNPD